MGYYTTGGVWKPSANEIASGEYASHEYTSHEDYILGWRMKEYRNKVLEEAAKMCEEGNLASNYACAEAIREMKK